MKKIYKKLRDVQVQIAEARSEMQAIGEWTLCRPAEKQSQLNKHTHWLQQLLETELTLLNQLKLAVTAEIEKHNNSINATSVTIAGV